MIETASLLRRLKENSQQDIIEIMGSRWGVLTSVRGVYIPGKTVWYTIQDK